MNRIFSFRNTNVLAVLAFVSVVILQACSQATVAPVPTNTDLLSKPTWLVSTVYVNGTLTPQTAKQTYKFNTDGTGDLVTAGSLQAIVWSFQNQEKSLRFGIAGFVVGSNLPTWTIDQLTSTSLKLSLTVSGTNFVTTFTAQ